MWAIGFDIAAEDTPISAATIWPQKKSLKCHISPTAGASFATQTGDSVEVSHGPPLSHGRVEVCVHVHWEPRSPALMFVDLSMSDPLSVILDRVDADFFGAFPGWHTSMRSRLRLRAGWYPVSGHETLADVAIERLCFHFDLFGLFFSRDYLASTFSASLIFESGLYDFDVFISP